MGSARVFKRVRRLNQLSDPLIILWIWFEIGRETKKWKWIKENIIVIEWVLRMRIAYIMDAVATSRTQHKEYSNNTRKRRNEIKKRIKQKLKRENCVLDWRVRARFRTRAPNTRATVHTHKSINACTMHLMQPTDVRTDSQRSHDFYARRRDERSSCVS